MEVTMDVRLSKAINSTYSLLSNFTKNKERFIQDLKNDKNTSHFDALMASLKELKEVLEHAGNEKVSKIKIQTIIREIQKIENPTCKNLEEKTAAIQNAFFWIEVVKIRDFLHDLQLDFLKRGEKAEAVNIELKK